MRTFGIDVSHWEGRIDWQAIAPGIGFAYFKCTDGTRFVDTQYLNNKLGCSKAGIPHAPYHYFQPALDPIAQADHFIDIAGKKYRKYIVDIEHQERDASITLKLHDFLVQVERLTGTRPAIYTSAGYWNEFVQPKPKWAGEYDLVVAHYTIAHSPMLPTGWKSYVIWQFSDYWNLPGCDENADANWFNGSLERCRAWFGNFRASISPQAWGSELKMRSLFNNLHIRQSPNMQARIVGKLDRDEIVEVSQLGGDDLWIRHVRGWTAVERGGFRYMEIQR